MYQINHLFLLIKPWQFYPCHSDDPNKSIQPILKEPFMLQYPKSKQKITVLLLTMLVAGLAGHSQKTTQATGESQPTWWFGASAAANFNFYRGTTQMLNENLTVPTAFHKGNGIKPYISLLTEYRPN